MGTEWLMNRRATSLNPAYARTLSFTALNNCGKPPGKQEGVIHRAGQLQGTQLRCKSENVVK
jgi:hypothetical protein